MFIKWKTKQFRPIRFPGKDPVKGKDRTGRGGWGKSGHFYGFCNGNFSNLSSKANDFHVKVAFIHRFRADIMNSRVSPIGAHIFEKTCCGPIYPRWGKSGHFKLHLHIPLGAHKIAQNFLPGCQELSWGSIKFLIAKFVRFYILKKENYSWAQKCCLLQPWKIC